MWEQVEMFIGTKIDFTFDETRVEGQMMRMRRVPAFYKYFGPRIQRPPPEISGVWVGLGGTGCVTVTVAQCFPPRATEPPPLAPTA